jgi:alpha-L-fucosidase
MLTRRDRTLYVHLNKDPLGDGVKLKPFNVAPKRATLLNTGKPVDFVVNLTPADHQEQKAYLRLMHLPANEMANTVLVAKLEFDRDVEQLVQPNAGPDGFTEWQK